MGVGILIGSVLVIASKWAKEKKLTLTVFEGTAAVYGLALLFLPIPLLIAFPLMAPVLVGASLFQGRGRVGGPRWSKFAMLAGALVVGVGAFFFFKWMFGSTRFTLDEERVVTYDPEPTVAPRVGLEVHALSSRWGGFMSNSWSWTSFGADDSLGPHLGGSDYYWGPSGMVRGDDAARRLAAWAGTEPEYSSR